MTAGLTEDGFEAKRLDQIQTDVKTRLRPTYGSGVDSNEDNGIMQTVDPVLIELVELWQGARLQYDFLNPNAAEGVALDNIGAITNTPRVAGANSTVLVEVVGSESSTIAVGFQRGVETTNELFATTELITLPAVGLQPLEITMTALNDGEVVCLAGELNQGALPPGITSMVNAVDANVGSEDETDEEYRVGRPARLNSLAGGTRIAIRDALLALVDSAPPVTAATVFENDTDLTDADGLPPHSVRALVTGGADQDIWDVLGVKKGGGTYTQGAQIGTFTDPVDGKGYTMRFDRTTLIAMYVDVVITNKNTDLAEGPIYPASGDQDIEDAILALIWADGQDVTLPRLQSAVTATVGINTYTLFFAITATPLTDTTVVIGNVEQADFDSTRTSVTS